MCSIVLTAIAWHGAATRFGVATPRCRDFIADFAVPHVSWLVNQPQDRIDTFHLASLVGAGEAVVGRVAIQPAQVQAHNQAKIQAAVAAIGPQAIARRVAEGDAAGAIAAEGAAAAFGQHLEFLGGGAACEGAISPVEAPLHGECNQSAVDASDKAFAPILVIQIHQAVEAGAGRNVARLAEDFAIG